jgi:hypothetical protein
MQPKENEESEGRSPSFAGFANADVARHLTVLAALADVQTSLDVLDRRSEELLRLTRRLVEDVLEDEVEDEGPN